MKAQFFVISAVILSFMLYSIVNYLDVPNFSEEIYGEELHLLTDSIQETIRNFYSRWYSLELENSVTFEISESHCDSRRISASIYYDFPDATRMDSVTANEETQVLWEDNYLKKGYIVFPVEFDTCGKKYVDVFYNLYNEPVFTKIPEYLINYTSSPTTMEINSTRYRAVLSKSSGWAISELYIKAGTSDMSTRIGSVYRCNGTTYNQRSNTGELEVLEAGPTVIRVKISSDHGLGFESFEQTIDFFFDRIEIYEKTYLSGTLGCSSGQDHTYGHLVDVAGSPSLSHNEWIDYNYGTYGLGIIKESSFESNDTSSGAAYLNALDSTSMSGTNDYKLTVYPYWGDSSESEAYSSMLDGFQSTAIATRTKEEFIDFYKAMLSDALGGFGYDLHLLKNEGEMSEQYNSQDNWYHQSNYMHYISWNSSTSGWVNTTKDWTSIAHGVPILPGYFDSNSIRVKEFSSKGVYLNDTPFNFTGTQEWFLGMEATGGWALNSSNSASNYLGSDGDALIISINASESSTFANYSHAASLAYPKIALRYRHDAGSRVDLLYENATGVFSCALPNRTEFSEHTCETSNPSKVFLLLKSTANDNQMHWAEADWIMGYRDNATLYINAENGKYYRIFLSGFEDDSERESAVNQANAGSSTQASIPDSVSRGYIRTDSPTDRKTIFISTEENKKYWPIDFWADLGGASENYTMITDEKNMPVPSQVLEKDGDNYRIGIISNNYRSKKYYIYTDSSESIVFNSSTDLSFDSDEWIAENSYIYWDFDDNIFRYKNSTNWFVDSKKWHTDNGTDSATSLSNWVLHNSGPAVIKVGCSALNIEYNISIFAMQKMILVEASGNDMTFGPYWAAGGDNNTAIFVENDEVNFTRDVNHSEIPQKEFPFLGARGSSHAIVVFPEYEKLVPSSDTIQFSDNYTLMRMHGTTKAYLLPDEFSYWEKYEDISKSISDRHRATEDLVYFTVRLSSPSYSLEGDII